MELGHTNNYLALENKRFPGKIRVEYFIEAEDFLIPSLTLQPVVENAVRYGVTQREDGGIVKIISRDAGKYYEIVVEDDGVGFDIDATKPDGRTHLGMDRIRKRLEDMCGGSLAAKSTPDVGTTVRITIPKRGGTAV
jgi:LytS/YehU family sensor histidine kinase